MSKRKLKIISISSELAPFSQTGGLADVSRSLPKALKRLGHEVIAVTPLYGQVIDKKKEGLKMVFENIEIGLNGGLKMKVNYWQGYLMNGLPVYFIENKKYFSRKKDLYGSTHENSRFLLFDLAALELLLLLKCSPDIIHCHDWQTGLIPYFMKNNSRYSKGLKAAKTVFTIHNLVFQLGGNWWEVPAAKKDQGKKAIPPLHDAEVEFVNFAKRGILNADIVNTVSEQYREEIMTKNFGQDLHRILKNREDRLFGIVNGIDYKEYSPLHDKRIFVNYDHYKIHRKKLNKESLQKKVGLPINREVPLICMTSRVTFQKGFALINKILDQLLKLNVQILVMGDGDKNYIKEIKGKKKRNAEKIVWLPFSTNKRLETLVYAGSDFFLLPSHHEPCGINQLIAMRYGCIPIVRRVGGLYDTVENFNYAENYGTGFAFSYFNEYFLFAEIMRALEVYKDKKIFKSIIARAMKESNSWKIPAEKYVELYKKAKR